LKDASFVTSAGPESENRSQREFGLVVCNKVKLREHFGHQVAVKGRFVTERTPANPGGAAKLPGATQNPSDTSRTTLNPEPGPLNTGGTPFELTSIRSLSTDWPSPDQASGDQSAS
jgi:hypothetical protein